MTLTSSATEVFSVTTVGSTGVEPIVSEEVYDIFRVINFVVIAGTVSFFGCIFNIINVIVFVRQGFQESANVALCGLAVSDFFSLLTLFWMGVCFLPDFTSWTGWKYIDVQYVTASWPHVCFARTTGWITSFITLERCLCISKPLRVKEILTPKRSFIVILVIYTAMLLNLVPVFSVIYFEEEYDTETNRTLLGMTYRYGSDGEFIESMSLMVSVFSQMTSFILVIICTIIIVYNLKGKTKWRQGHSENRDSASTRDKRAMNMVLLIATIFILCFLPSVISMLIMLSWKRYAINGDYVNLFLLVWGFVNDLEAANSSVNIFVYYRMSTRYRQTLQEMIPWCKGSGKNGEDYAEGQD